MITPRLTANAKAAKLGRMVGTKKFRRCSIVALPVLSAVALSGCISVKAPDKPIVI